MLNFDMASSTTGLSSREKKKKKFTERDELSQHSESIRDGKKLVLFAFLTPFPSQTFVLLDN